MKGDLPRAIVFNCHFNGLSIIQELATNGIQCIAMDSARSIGTYSKYAEFVRCPDPSSNESRFVDFLYEFCSRERVKPILFPTNDQWATAVSRHKERLSQVAILCVADWTAVQTVVEKDRFYALGQERDFPTPRTWTHAELTSLTASDFPLAAKPIWRRNSSDGRERSVALEMDRLRLTVLEDRSALEGFLERERRWLDHLIFQTYVPGLSDAMYTVGIYADGDHRLRGIFTGRKVRGYPADSGDCVVGEVSSVPETLIETTRRIVAELGISGIAEFEFKRDPTTGSFTLIEVNPRSWSWIGITPAAGVSLPLIAYRDLAGLGVQQACQRQTALDGTVRYVKVLQDAMNVWLLYRFDYRDWSNTPWGWYRELHDGARIIRAEFHAKDFPVWIMSSWMALRGLIRELKDWLQSPRGKA